jgi:SAM-dependent methyltransferase
MAATGIDRRTAQEHRTGQSLVTSCNRGACLGGPDLSNGYEALAGEFAASRDPNIGAATVRAWAQTLPPGATVLDLGCGTGVPITRAILDQGLTVYGVDASPAMISAFRANFPDVPVACESVEASEFFGRTFGGIVAWGLIFLLPPASQRALIRRAAAALEPGGRFLFTAPAPACTWNDLLTGRRSISLGASAYREQLTEAGLSLVAEYDDEGDNHYFESRK